MPKYNLAKFALDASTMAFASYLWLDQAKLVIYAKLFLFSNQTPAFCRFATLKRGMGLDQRIGNKFLMAGIGYGGSCFPKDTKALQWHANCHDYELKTIKAAIEVNENQKTKLIKKARKYYENFHGLTVAVLGLTYKPGTDDLREAPSLQNIPSLLEDGANIKAWDPLGVENYKKIYPTEIAYCGTIEEAISCADVCLIFTEWPQIKEFDVSKFAKLMRKPLVLDGRNCYDINKLENLGVTYVSIGRRSIVGNKFS